MKNKRIAALIAIAIFTFMTSLDSSIVNIATPIMAKEMNVSSSTIEWVISIYINDNFCTDYVLRSTRRYCW